ncbi:DUF6992 family protein [Niabella drilacis]|uniref:Outer membrane protein beta-barrel domain-containing protein n=1 Tax=Niabella drilacis (strain DSM 25811 / CCM 8410 / CCUG 62505 / LMG 26954 / E90) TaxID=1285928 RepID=A0A1G6ZUG2_NIADE|nr:hypothetical protein [Niabella drilacis]SDE05475.1 hypothetical protein SAMN04487894_11942 [Niabella drilacis]
MKWLSVILLSCFYCFSQAQENSIPNTEMLHQQRIETNRKGMWVLSGWGLANMGSGIIGALNTTNTEVKAFHTMNALWGVVNTGIGVLGLMRAKREKSLSFSDADKYRAYKNVKKLYLINGGLDVLYMGTGAFLKARADNAKNPARNRGYGNSLIVQGAGLLLYDITMYLSHQKQNRYWKKAVQELAVTENGIGMVYHF